MSTLTGWTLWLVVLSWVCVVQNLVVSHLESLQCFLEDSHSSYHVIESRFCVGLLLSGLESTIIATSLVTISSDLGGFSKSNWIVEAYFLTYTGLFILLLGRWDRTRVNIVIWGLTDRHRLSHLLFKIEWHIWTKDHATNCCHFFHAMVFGVWPCTDHKSAVKNPQLLFFVANLLNVV